MNGKKMVDKKVKKRRKRLLILTLLLGFIIFSLLAFKTKLFHISKIDVIGNKKITTNNIIKALGNPNGENIFKVNTKEMKNKINKHPYIKTSSIKRKIPNKLLVQIVEREERAAIKYANSYVYIDEEGFVLKIDPNTIDGKLTTIKGISINNPSLGEKINGPNDDTIEGMLEFINICVKLKLTNRIAQLDLENMEDVNIVLNDGIVVAFGPLDNVKYKLSYVDSILKDIEKKNILCKYIYFNRGENPVIVIDNN